MALGLSLNGRHGLFVEKQEWLEASILRLESHILPAIDGAELDDECNECVLESAWSELHEIDNETQRLDQTELHHLRNMAKAATQTQKNLSSEDTDVLEVTLGALSALDKLLHLMRQRNNELKLLSARIKWNSQRRQVETEYRTIIEVMLPRYLKKARWAPSEDIQSGSSLLTQHGVETDYERPAATAMARKMRAEVLSLDLSALLSRLRSLQTSLLPASGRILDTMIDVASKSLPDRFLDQQDSLEKRIQDGTVGLADFAQSMLRQWRQAEEIWNTLITQEAELASLLREVATAVLKSPTPEVATMFEDQLSECSESISQAASSMKTIEQPHHPSIAAQDDKNKKLNELFGAKIAYMQQNALSTATTQIAAYRDAATAIVEASACKAELSSLLDQLRSAQQSIPVIALDNYIAEDCDAISHQVLHCRQLCDSAQTKALPEAAQILSKLQNNGVDPNLRFGLHECIVAVTTASRSAAGTYQKLESRLQILRQLLKWRDGCQKLVHAAEIRCHNIRDVAKRVAWSSSRSEEEEVISEEAYRDLHATARAEYDALTSHLVQAYGEATARSVKSQLQCLLTELSDQDCHMQQAHAILSAVQMQSSTVQAIERRSILLRGQLLEVLEWSSSSDLSRNNINDCAHKLQQLRAEVAEFDLRLSEQTLWDLAPEDSLKAWSVDLNRRVKNHLNSLSVHLATQLDRTDKQISNKEKALTLEERLLSLQNQITRIWDDLADLGIPHGDSSGSLELVLNHISEIAGLSKNIPELPELPDNRQRHLHASVTVSLSKLSAVLQLRLQTARCQAIPLPSSPIIHDEDTTRSDEQTTQLVSVPQISPLSPKNKVSRSEDTPRPAKTQTSVIDPRSESSGAHTDATVALDQTHTAGSLAHQMVDTRTDPFTATDDKCPAARSYTEDIVRDIAKAITSLPAATSSQLKLPTIEDWQDRQDICTALQAKLDDSLTTATEEARSTLQRLLDSTVADNSRMQRLADFTAAALKAEKSTSLLLDAMDDVDRMRADEQLIMAEHDIRHAQEAAQPFSDDSRVVMRLDRLNRAFRDVKAAASGEGETSSVTSFSTRASSSAIRRVASEGRRMHVNQNKPPMQTTQRRSAAISVGDFKIPRVPTSSGIVISSPQIQLNTTPAKSMKPFLTPRRPRGVIVHSSPTIPSSRRSPVPPGSYSAGATPSPRRSSTRRMSGIVNNLTPSRPNKYKANPRRKLDIAVERIVNELQVPVSIRAADDWQDTSGKYYIGSPEPKLYFARILRSRTVMLRVGGGWEELGSFLATHFDHLFSSTSDGLSSPTMEHKTHTSPTTWLSASRLRQSQSQHGLSLIAASQNGILASSTPATPRSVSQTSSAFDLTTLLTKSSNDPRPSAGTSQPRNKSAPIPWRL